MGRVVAVGWLEAVGWLGARMDPRLGAWMGLLLTAWMVPRLGAWKGSRLGAWMGLAAANVGHHLALLEQNFQGRPQKRNAE